MAGSDEKHIWIDFDGVLRAWNFDGSFPDPIDVKNFKPWWR